MTAQPGPARLPSLGRYLWSWVVGALLVVWATLLLVAWYTGHHEAEEITDGQLEALAAPLAKNAYGQYLQKLLQRGHVP